MTKIRRWWRVVAALTGLLMLMGAALPDASAQAPAIKRQKFPAGSPEAIVESLMYYDFIGVARGTEDRNPFVAFEPDDVRAENFGSYSPLTACESRAIAYIDSYRVIGGQHGVAIGAVEARANPLEYYVTVEVAIRGVSVFKSMLPPVVETSISCGWLGLQVSNKRTHVVEYSRDNVDGAIELRRALYRFGRGKDSLSGDVDYVIHPDIRTWIFGVKLVRSQERRSWVLEMPIIPAHRSAAMSVKKWIQLARVLEDDLNLCRGIGAIPVGWRPRSGSCDIDSMQHSIRSIREDIHFGREMGIE